MHNTHENTLGKASAKNSTIFIIIQGGNTYELYKALALSTILKDSHRQSCLLSSLPLCPPSSYFLALLL